MTASATRRPRATALLIASLVGAWLLYAVAFGLAVAVEARTADLALSRWLAHVGTAPLAGLLMARIATQLQPRHPAYHLAGAIVTSAIWALAAATVLDVLTSELRWLSSYRDHPGRARWQLLVGAFMYAVTGLLVALDAARGRLRATQLELEREARLRAEAQLAAIRARLDPHFLFNTLHSMVSLARQRPEEVGPALERFAALLRYTLRSSDPAGGTVTWAAEWSAIEDYLALERMRLGSRLVVRPQIEDESLGWELPALVVQPLVENAIRHAVAVRSAPTTVEIATWTEDECLHIRVTDDGPGAGDEGVEAGARGSGVGLDAITERMRARYGAAGVVEILPRSVGFGVELTLPAEETLR